MNRFNEITSHILVILGLFLFGCPDPESELNAYLDRVEQVPTAPDMNVPTSGCGDFEDPTGTYFVSVNTNIAPGTPLLFEGQFNIDTTVEPKTAQLTLIPLTVADKTPIEDLPEREGDSPVVSPVVPIDDEGKFEMDLGTVIVAGIANPVSGSEIEANLTIQGQILSGSFVCGTVTGNLVRPSEFDLGNGGGGSTFALKPACGQSYDAIEPTLNCVTCEEITALACSGNTDGAAGTAGADGTAGTAGTDGAAGTAGTDGAAGTAGADGAAGAAGTDGTAGAAGAAGTDGTAGTAGTD